MFFDDWQVHTPSELRSVYPEVSSPTPVAPANERKFIFDFGNIPGVSHSGECFVHIHRFKQDGSAIVLLVDVDGTGACVSAVAGEVAMALYRFCLPDMVPQFTPDLITFLERDRLGDWAHIELEWRTFGELLHTRVVRWRPLPLMHDGHLMCTTHMHWCREHLPDVAFWPNPEW